MDQLHVFPFFCVLAALISPTWAVYGVDVSQYTSLSAFRCLRERHGFRFAIIRAFESSGRPDRHVVENIQHAKEAGFEYVDVYMFPCYRCRSDAGRQVSEMLDALRSVDREYGTIWLDIEGSRYWSSSSQRNLNFIADLYSHVRSQSNHRVGIYSSHYNWRSLTGDSDYFSSRGVPVWYAHYDGETHFSDWSFEKFGGWQSPAIKQYVGNADECGAGLDKNYYP